MSFWDEQYNMNVGLKEYIVIASVWRSTKIIVMNWFDIYLPKKF